ncbi:MAG: carbon-phosphorus lyase complex subunit PhnI [Fibrobacterota bacterium]
MAYSAVKGGREAIENSIDVLQHSGRGNNSPLLRADQIKHQLHFGVDRVMGEGSLYAPDLAAMAIRQSAGDTFEAAFILRAYRATLPRLAYTRPVQTENMRIIRRISAAFKDIPGGQILGPSADYTLRLLDFTPAENAEEEASQMNTFLREAGLTNKTAETFPKVVEILREEDLLSPRDGLDKKESAPADITRDSIQFPASRSAALQTMARGETGGMLSLAYSNMRGYGSAHPTIGELRVGYVPLSVENPVKKTSQVIGEVLVTEAEIMSKVRLIGGKPRVEVGYGFCFGHNETKAISMATLDIAMRTHDPKFASEDQEFVLTHIDGIEAMGFANHFKLPHYVTFQSQLDRLRRSQRQHEDTGERKEQ